MMGHGRYTPREWEESEARRKERRQRSHNPYGRPLSRRSRQITGALFGLVAVGLVIYALMGWLGIIPIPGITA